MTTKDYVGVVRKALNAYGVPFEEYSVSDEGMAFKMTVAGCPEPCTMYDVAAIVDGEYVISRAIFPIGAPLDRMSRIAEYAARANQNMRCGSLLANFDNGHITAEFYYSTVALAAGSDNIVETLFGIPTTVLAVHAAHLVRLIAGDAMPSEEYALYESEAEKRLEAENE